MCVRSILVYVIYVDIRYFSLMNIPISTRRAIAIRIERHSYTIDAKGRCSKINRSAFHAIFEPDHHSGGRRDSCSEEKAGFKGTLVNDVARVW